MKYVIIGNGAAGIAAAERIRKLDCDGEIAILTSENYAVYSKCLLPDFLSGCISEERMYIRQKDFYDSRDIDIYYGHKVLNIDFNLRQVITENRNSYSANGAVFHYDKLLIASGGTQLLPPVQGLDYSNAYFLGTLDQAKRIVKDSREARRIVIIGAGFVGLEAAFNLYKTGREITVIERFPRILPGLLDEKASRIIQNAVEEEGIRLILDAAVSEIHMSSYTKVAEIISGSNTRTVVLNDGRRFKADMIIVATGSRPNLEFLKNPGLEVDKGIVVDRHMQTSIRDVYAAGDVVQSIDAVTGRKSLSPIWPNAVIQGEAAGSNMAGNIREFDNLISMQNASEFREIPMISMGLTVPDGPGYEEYADCRPADMVYRKLLIKDDTVVGMIFLGDIKNAGVIGALMKNKTNVARLKKNMLNSNFSYSEAANLV